MSECSNRPRGRVPYGVDCWKVSHEQASLCTPGNPLLGPPELIPYLYQIASRTVPLLGGAKQPKPSLLEALT